jgi:hypothetical protein
MLNLDSIKIEVREIDISGFVTGLTIYESIFGTLQGQIAVRDSTNFFDNFIGTELAGVNITWKYLNNDYTCSFYMDGITNMKMQKENKNYTIHLKSAHDPQFAETINGVYNGTSDEIIALMFAEVSAEQSTIAIDSRANTSGRYIAPNIPVKKCFKTLIANSYCAEQSGLFLYERFVDGNTIRLTSLYDMIENRFIDASGVPVVIANTIMSAATMNPLATLGTSDNFEMKEYSMDLIRKLENGLYGEAINVINLDETKRTANITKEATSVPKTKFKLSDKLYDDNVKSVLANKGDVSAGTIINRTIKAFNTTLDVTDMVALPALGCGMTVEVELGGNEEQGTKRHDGKWLIKNIQHNFTQKAGEYSYAQTLGLVRE